MMDISVELSVFNNIKYYDEPHTYFIDGKEMTSVTRLINKFKQSLKSYKSIKDLIKNLISKSQFRDKILQIELILLL